MGLKVPMKDERARFLPAGKKSEDSMGVDFSRWEKSTYFEPQTLSPSCFSGRKMVNFALIF